MDFSSSSRVAYQFGAVLAVGLLAISRPHTRAIYLATGDDEALSMFPAARPRSRSRRACVCVCVSLSLSLSLSLCGSRLGVGVGLLSASLSGYWHTSSEAERLRRREGDSRWTIGNSEGSRKKTINWRAVTVDFGGRTGGVVGRRELGARGRAPSRGGGQVHSGDPGPGMTTRRPRRR